MKPPKLVKLHSVTHLVGESQQAPGLKTRDHEILNRAIGLAPGKAVPQMHLAALASYHPDPKVQNAAVSMLKSLQGYDATEKA